MLDIEDHVADRAPDTVYQALLDRGVLGLPRCHRCSCMHFPPRVMCPHCGSPDLEWAECSGLGTVYSTSSLHPRNGDAYAVVLVDLDEGPRMMSNIIGTPGDKVSIGQRVRVRFDSREGTTLPLFEVAGE